jgi:phage terminase small subunit
MVDKFTHKEAAFIAALPECNWIQTDAVLKAGYRAKSRQIAAEIGTELLNKTKVRRAIERMREEMLKRAGIYQERLLVELAKIAYSEIENLYDENGTLKPVREWPKELRGVVQNIKSTEIYDKDGKLTGFNREVKGYSKTEAIKLLGEHLHLWGRRFREPSEIPVETRQISDIELAAKIFYFLNQVIERSKERKALEQKETKDTYEDPEAL